jgi:ribosome biogenesis GTPase
VRLENGALLMDTPGMRELGLWDGSGLATAFAEIDALEAACRFRDCTHDNEPGCAVNAARDSGGVSAGRLDNYHKLQRESHRHRKRLEAD